MVAAATTAEHGDAAASPQGRIAGLSAGRQRLTFLTDRDAKRCQDDGFFAHHAPVTFPEPGQKALMVHWSI